MVLILSCANYIRRFLKLHGWDTDSSKPLPSEMIPSSVSKFDCVNSNSSIDYDTKRV